MLVQNKPDFSAKHVDDNSNRLEVAYKTCHIYWINIATNCAPKPVFVLDRFYVVFDASVL